MDVPQLKTAHENRSHRRLSMDDSMNGLINRIRGTMDRLNELWDEVHMEERIRESRVEYAYLHFYTLLEDIIKAEEDMVKGVKSDIELRRIAIVDLREMLNMPNFDGDAFPENSIALLKALDKELNELTKKRDVAVEAQLNEYEILKECCQRLDKKTSYDCNDVRCRIFSSDEFHRLQIERRRFAELVATRLERVNKIQSECRRMYKTLKETLSFSAEQHNLLNTDFDAAFNPIGDDVVNNLEKMHNYMTNAYSSWLEQAVFQYSELLIEFRDIAEKCCVEYKCSVYPEQFDLELHDRDIIEKLAEEVKELKRRYELGGSVFDKFSQWKLLWQEKINRELEASSSRFYQNRGGQLNTFLKRQKQLNLLVPKALEEVRTAVQDYLYMECGDGNDIRIEDLLPDEYAEFLMNEHQQEKELHKTLKSNQQQVNGTTMFSKQKMPIKKATPSKLKVQSGKVAKRKYSFSKQKLSIISPIRTPICGPKTSSPKTLWATVHSTCQRTPLNARYENDETTVAADSPLASKSRMLLGKTTASMPHHYHQQSRRNLVKKLESTHLMQTPTTSKLPLKVATLRNAGNNLNSGKSGSKTPTGVHWRY